jgi:hypothetical protein
VDTVIYPDAQACEENGKRFSQSVVDLMACVICAHSPMPDLTPFYREKNINAMRLGPGKHLKGLTLLDGVVKPEEFDYFRA